uniref:CD180 molecule n=1 Tax=Leptobrachium leishanense TaxID=445787 RepID=A0A8C5M128_9ANUR
YIHSISYSCEGLGLLEVPKGIPLTTKILDFSFNSLFSLYDSTFSQLRNLTYLDLTRCQINWIFDNVFQSNIQLRTLILIGNPVLYIKDYAFSGAVSLKSLFLQQSSITNISDIKLTSLDSLETLSFGHNFISSVKLPDGLPTEKLQTLDLQFNNIKKIYAKDTDVIQGIKNLSLILKGNQIDYIEPGSFNSSKLFNLDLTACGQNMDLAVLLAGLHGLSTNILRIGTFEEVERKFLITPNTLHGLCNISVKHISFQYVYFDQFSSDTFSCFTDVQCLDLTNTGIDFLPTFKNSLREVVLSRNKFGSICDINTERLTLLKRFHFRGNHNDLFKMGSGCFKNLSSLQFLDLSLSNIGPTTDCCRDQFSGLVNLKHLNFSYNNMHTLNGLPFPDSDKLEVLDLAYTPISIGESSGPFGNLNLLKVLNLSHTYINASNEEILQGLHSLLYLNLKKSIFEFGVIKSNNLLKHTLNLEVLILSSCEITVIEEQAFSSLKTLKYIDLSENKLLQFYSNAFGDLSHIHLNFAFNRITVIPLHVVHSISGTSVINLSHNPLDCSCANIEFILWQKQNIQMFEENDNTLCWFPQLRNGTELSKLAIRCGLSSGQIFVIILAVIVLIITLTVFIRYYRKKRYSSI